MRLLIKNSPKLLEIFWLILIITIGTLLMTSFLSVRSWYKPYIKLNEVSPITIVLNHNVKVEDQLKTNELRKEAGINAIRMIGDKEILTIDPEASQESFDKLRFLVEMTREQIFLPRDIYEMPINQKISLETQSLLLNLNENKFNSLFVSKNFSEIFSNNPNTLAGPLIELNEHNLAIDELNKLNEIEKKEFLLKLAAIRDKRSKTKIEKLALGAAFFDAIRAMNYEDLFIKTFTVQKKLLDLGLVHGLPKRKIQENIRILFPFLNEKESFLITKLIERSTTPNLKIDWSKLEAIKLEAMSQVNPVMVELKPGSKLAIKGEDVSEQNYYYLKNLNMLKVPTDWREIISNLIILISLITIAGLLYFFNEPRSFSLEKILMVFLVSSTISGILAALSTWGLSKLALVPLASMGILITIFYAPIVAFFVTTMICFFMIKSLDMSFWQVLPLYVGGIYSVFLAKTISQRNDLANAGTKIAISQVTVFLLTIIIAVSDFEVTSVLIIASFYAISGIASGFISLAILPYLEMSLKLLTPFKLAELANPNQILLKRLHDKAPGTYEHSMNVAKFSEEAANALGLNTDLIRVGILYHDIGKMHAPNYFIENNLGKSNPHAELDNPLQSAEIILAHIPEGIKLAKRYNLPQAIIDFIPMHQGTTVTNYFYQKAIDKYGAERVNANDYRYPGPKPNSKETGIAMIADSVEAALRSFKDLDDEKKIQEIINGIINSRVNEGELEYTNLSRADLNKISEAFLNTWRSQNHERIKYPNSTI